MDCACAQQPSLWTTGENPVDKPVEKSQHAMSLYLTTKDLDLSDTQEALINALDVLTARVDALEHDIWTIAHMNAPASESSGAGADPQPDQEVMDQ